MLHWQSWNRLCSRACIAQRGLTRLSSTSALARPIQSYISKSNDPYLNLSIEHHLLQKSPPDSRVLLFYINRPCVVIGRNQNPWSEVNHTLIRRGHVQVSGQGRPGNLEPHSIDLVRRRSGGGTVFHDAGNVNWTVICSSAEFTRDKHAEMVVRALRRLGKGRARVNERHDVVLDQGRLPASAQEEDVSWGASEDTHSTPWQRANPVKNGALKVSGSAYKLTRGRALHHGTALLETANLRMIPHVLESPARAWIKGRGVDSVSSPVGNLGLNNDDFIGAVQREFVDMYGDVVAQAVGEDWLEIEQVRKGYEELKSAEWTYLQTPQFSISNWDLETEPSASVPGLKLTVRNGIIAEADIKLDHVSDEVLESFKQSLQGVAIHEVTDWPERFSKAGMAAGAAFAYWLQDCLIGLAAAAPESE